MLLFTPFWNTILNFKIIAVNVKISLEFIQYNLSEQFCIVQTLYKLQLQNNLKKKMYFTTAFWEKTFCQLAAKLVASNIISISEKHEKLLAIDKKLRRSGNPSSYNVALGTAGAQTWHLFFMVTVK